MTQRPRQAQGSAPQPDPVGGGTGPEGPRAGRDGRRGGAEGRGGSPEGPSSALLRRFLEPSRAPSRIGALIYVIGVLNIVSSLWHPWRTRLHVIAEYLPGGVTGAASLTAIVSGVLLVLLGRSLRRGKRRAWWAAIVLTAVSLLAHLARGVHHAPASTLLAVVGVVLLVVYRREFRAKGDPSTRWGALGALVALALASVLVGWLTLLANRHAYAAWPGAVAASGDAVRGIVGGDLSGLFRPEAHRVADVVGVVLPGLGVMTVIVPVLLWFRPSRQPSTLRPEDDARVRALLEVHPDSLGYFTTRQDKEVVWSQSGKSCIGYRVVAGVMLAAGDPVGDPEAWPGAIRAFLARADEYAWVPAVLGCSERAATTWVRETGFEALELGDEAIVDTADFSLEGRSMRNVRQMVNRIRRLGYETEMLRVEDTTPHLREQATRDADTWRVGGTERGFSMATSRVLDAERDPGAFVVLARREGVVEGMLQFVPWGVDGMSLDLMRRNPKADPGINELLICDALAKAPALGIRRVSLNFAMFRSTFERGEKIGAGPVLKAWRRILLAGNRWFQLESLYRFNAKFQPQWYPRYVIYPRAGDIMRVGLAMGEAEAFIVFPRLTLPFRAGR